MESTDLCGLLGLFRHFGGWLLWLSGERVPGQTHYADREVTLDLIEGHLSSFGCFYDDVSILAGPLDRVRRDLAGLP